jgi:AraC-like DNA-binding protein
MIRCPTTRSSAAAALPATESILWLPEPALASCVRAVIWRDTRGADLCEAQRLNFFGISPYFSLSWMFEGDAEQVEAPTVSQACAASPRRPVPGPIALTGPAGHPRVSYNPGPVRVLMLVFVPDALHHLAGLRGEDWMGRTTDAREALPPDWTPWLDEVLRAASPERALQSIETFLTARWTMSRPQRAVGATVNDWLQSLALRLAMSGAGRSVRQVERRFRSVVGQSFRSLRVHARNERAYLRLRQAYLSGNLQWADAAVDGGYADQPHLVRESIRATGFPPGELARRAQRDESFWIYRLWN